MKNKKKVLIIAGFYFISFIVALILANNILNYDRVHPSRNQGDTSLIKLSVKSNGMKINGMDAYVQEMNAAYLRLSITPVSENKTVTLLVDEPEANVSKISYALMDESNQQEIESGECPEIQRVEGQRQTTITFESDLQAGREYCLNLTVVDDQKQTNYYYTRIIYGNNLRAYDKLQFAEDFHSATFEKTAMTRIAEYLEFSSDAVSNDFRNVSLSSDSEIVTWGNLEPEIVSDVDMRILELDEQHGEIQLVYEIEVRDDVGNDYNYTVKEIYDIAATGSRVFLRDYSRTMEEKLDNQSFTFNGNQLRLGLVDQSKMDIHVYGKQETEEETVAETGEEAASTDEEYNTYISFVADGGLWVYNSLDNILTQAFGFERQSQVSRRDASYLNHGVKVLRTEDNGDLYFAVYGYMYNGDNEGKFGIEINRYSRVEGTWSEVLFIPYDKSFSMLNRGIQKMAFMDDNDMFYLCLEDTIYRFDTIMRQVSVVMEQAESDDCAIAANGRSVVVSERDDTGQITAIKWRNLETGETHTVNRNKNNLYMIGMLGEDLVYGIGNTVNTEERINEIRIVDEKMNVLKEYTVTGGYITSASIRGTLMEIHRKTAAGEDMSVDYIVYNETDKYGISVTNTTQELRKRESWLVTGEYGNRAPVVVYARAIEAYRNTRMVFEPQGETYDGYYVYVNDNLSKHSTFKEAYIEARESGGKVLDNLGRIICRPAVRTNEADLDGYNIALAETDVLMQQRAVLEWILKYEGISEEPILSGDNMFENLQANLPDVHVVDMSGISLHDALTMVSEGIPLVVVNSEGTWCVVEGYVNGYIVVADPKDGTVSGYEYDSAVGGIASSGNIIYSYYR